MKRITTILTVLLAACFLIVGCTSQQGRTTPLQEVQAWDAILQHSISVVRAAVEFQPPGPRRDKLLAQIDQVQTWEALGAAVSEVAAAGITVPAGVPTTQPSVN